MNSERSVVWLLGAGFSKSLGAPLLSEMLSNEAATKVLLVYPDLQPQEASFREVVNNYQRGAYGMSHFKWEQRHWAHAEEFAERLDIASEDQTDVAGNIVRAFWKGQDFDGTPSWMWAGMMRDWTLWLMAGECCAFTEQADMRTERWAPYLRWASLLRPRDTVLSFNYDRVPDMLAEQRAKRGIRDVLHVMTPSEIKENMPVASARVLKLHGSVDWIRRGTTMGRVQPGMVEATHASRVAMYCDVSETGIATPGPSKHKLVRDKDGLGPLWDAAAVALQNADAIVLVGYSMPPSDAYSRRWLIEQLRLNVRRRASEVASSRPGSDAVAGLPVYTVLGSNTASPESARLKGLLESIPHIAVHQKALYAEDFLDVFERDALVRV